ncbi:tetratricopeptide repeat protein [Teredinibacter waterburyi]|uniref:tetratricopeptide repeat protein n=1 Tax=Teredinibacter waterburyi TaxID=1500538 RepID=UPI00165F3DBC|nr:tetratricopeptide repeat protein [Teredinibacter waterburyi]
MAYVNRYRAAQRSGLPISLPLIVLLVFLQACQSLPKNDQADASAVKKGDTEQSVDASVALDEAVPLVLIPDPYQSQQSNVSAQAKADFATALTAMNAKKWKQAEQMLTLLAATYPELSGPHVNLGIVQSELGERGKAELSFRRAIVINPANMDAYTHLGVLYRETGRFAEAEQVYLDALAAWPHHIASHRNIGILYDLYMGRLAEALPHYQMAQRLITLTSEKPDRKLKGWIVDLERRLAASER